MSNVPQWQKGKNMSEEIKLVLDKDPVPAAADVLEEIQEVVQEIPAAPYLEDANLTEAEMNEVNTFAEAIDITDSAIALNYGAAAQKKIAEFSETALNGVRTKDLGEVGTMLSSLVGELKTFSTNDTAKGLKKWFQGKKSALKTMKAKFDTVDKNVDKIVGALEDHQNQLTEDTVMLDKMYDTNLNYFKELTMYILAGKKRLEQEQNTTLVDLQNKAKETGLAEDAQAANDFSAMCDRFDKKLYDLELSRTISMQMAPQIRMIQNSDMLMIEKITSTVNNTIPLWKNQMVLTLGMAHADEAMKTQKEVNELTNELIKKNAETIKQGTVEIAKESEKGLVELETVKFSNEQLISALDEVVKIQEEGREKRREAENELGKIEAQLKAKLLDIRNAGTGAVEETVEAAAEVLEGQAVEVE